MAYETDPELERSTNSVMQVGAIIMVAMALVFPLYRWFEPTSPRRGALPTARVAGRVGRDPVGFQLCFMSRTQWRGRHRARS